MTKTVSENLDLILKYRSINLVGDPVSVNSIPIQTEWPRYIVLNGTTAWGDGLQKSNPNLTVSPVGKDNTFLPDLDINDYLGVAGTFNPIEIKQDCYLTIQVSITNEGGFNPLLSYAMVLIFQRNSPSDPQQVDSHRVGENVTPVVPSANVLSCTYTGFVKALDNFQMLLQTSDSSGQDGFVKVKITIHKLA